jgi:hypothetical protein
MAAVLPQRTFSRDEINNIIGQLTGISLHGESVFHIHQEDSLHNVAVKLNVVDDAFCIWLSFTLNPDEPETESERRVRESPLL